MIRDFKTLAQEFENKLSGFEFPQSPSGLYDPCRFALSMGGKRVRPVALLMAAELFSDLSDDAFHAAMAVELFHNFSLIHDDIMDKAPLRRGQPTIAAGHGENTALLAGDIVLIAAYDALNNLPSGQLNAAVSLFNLTARQVCEGQQLDMEFEKRDEVNLEEYLHMITLKTSVLLAASLRLGALIGGASLHNQELIYRFGLNLGIAFQIQDDYLDAFGDPAKFGKQVGGDILANKKTFLMIHALDTAKGSQLHELKRLMSVSEEGKVEKVLQIFRECGVDEWAKSLKRQFADQAMSDLEEIALLSTRKTELRNLAGYLLQRES